MFDNMTNDQLLDELDTRLDACVEPGAAWVAHRGAIGDMIQELQTRGVYPKDTPPSCEFSVPEMVQFWGARWFEYHDPITCPKCSADLRAPEGPPFTRVQVGMFDDFSVKYVCPDCKGHW